MAPVCSRPLVNALRRRGHDDAGDALLDLVAEMEGYLTDGDGRGAVPWTGDGLMATFGLRTRVGEVRLFTMIATLGTPLEVTAADLAVETFLPADAESAELLRTLAEERQSGAPRRGPRSAGPGPHA